MLIGLAVAGNYLVAVLFGFEIGRWVQSQRGGKIETRWIGLRLAIYPILLGILGTWSLYLVFQLGSN